MDTYQINVACLGTHDYVPQIRVLASSLQSIHPTARLHTLFVDPVSPELRKLLEPQMVVYELSQLRLENLLLKAASHTAIEFCCSLKGEFLHYLLTENNIDRVLYFDADIMIFSSLDELWRKLTKSEVLLTPHYLDLSHTLSPQNECMYLNSGTFNAGFLGVRKTPHTLHFLKWWSARSWNFGYEYPDPGPFTDQIWLNLVPGMVKGVEILEHPGMNVSLATLRGRELSQRGRHFFAKNLPLVFFHYHRFDTKQKPNEYFLGRLSPEMAASLWERYACILKTKSIPPIAQKKFVMGEFSSGRRVPFFVRCLLREQSRPEPSGSTVDDIVANLFSDQQLNSSLRAMAYYSFIESKVSRRDQFLENTRGKIRTQWIRYWFYWMAPEKFGFTAHWIEPNRWLRGIRYAIRLQIKIVVQLKNAFRRPTAAVAPPVSHPAPHRLPNDERKAG